MELIFFLLSIIIPIWLVLVLVMLPIYFHRRKKQPNNPKNTLKSLAIKSLIASTVFTLIFCSGFIMMYFDEMRGIYR